MFGILHRNPIIKSLFVVRPFLCISSTTRFLMSNRKSPEQRAYFESRQAMKHNFVYPHFRPTITLEQYLKKYQVLKQNQEVDKIADGKGGGQREKVVPTS
jgi:hypothetical protein